MLHERLRIEQARDELAEVQDVAAARLVQGVHRRSFHRAAQGRFERLRGALLGKGTQVDARQLVLPQLEEHPGRVVVAAQNDEEEDLPVERELEHQRGRRRVEEVRVVDAHDRSSIGLKRRFERGRGPAQAGSVVAAAEIGGKERCERAEWDPARGTRRPDVHHARTLPSDDRSREMRLADSRRPRDDDPARVRVFEQCFDLGPFAVPPDQRPRLRHTGSLARRTLPPTWTPPRSPSNSPISHPRG